MKESLSDKSIKAMYGLNRTSKWPVDGLPTIQIGTVEVWVNPIRRVREGRRPHFHLRVRGKCPNCQKEFAASRVWQHYKASHLPH